LPVYSCGGVNQPSHDHHAEPSRPPPPCLALIQKKCNSKNCYSFHFISTIIMNQILSENMSQGTKFSQSKHKVNKYTGATEK
jgi:hypothetical protein